MKTFSHKFKILSGFLSIFLCFKLIAQKDLLNQTAPKIKVNWLTTKKYHKNKPTILDFWFTTCAPCVYSIPHLNNRKEYYKDRVNFVAVSFEDALTVTNFLKKKELKALVGIDTSRITLNNYNVEAFPTTFLIDSKNVVRWY